jgi:hypothetical protein
VPSISTDSPTALIAGGGPAGIGGGVALALPAGGGVVAGFVTRCVGVLAGWVCLTGGFDDVVAAGLLVIADGEAGGVVGAGDVGGDVASCDTRGAVGATVRALQPPPC